MTFDRKLINRILVTLFVSIVVAVVIAYRYHFLFSLYKLFTFKTKNQDNNAKIKELHPIFGYKVSRFIKELEADGRTVKITSGYRSAEKQQQLVDQGLTPALPLSSYHNYGMAIDLNVDNLVQASSKSNWQPIADIAKQKYGFKWGGDFNNSWDKIHFYDGEKYKIEQLKSLYLTNNLVNKKFVKIY